MICFISPTASSFHSDNEHSVRTASFFRRYSNKKATIAPPKVAIVFFPSVFLQEKRNNHSKICIFAAQKNLSMAIRIQNITKHYGAQKALNKVSLEINTGEIVGLLGPNGAGKSTMMKIITCFLPPSEGSVSVNGFDIFENSEEVRRSVGYLPEHNPLYHDMYVREYLEFVAGVYKLKNKSSRIEKMIELTGLELEQHKKIGALSKGYRQRVGLAQAMIHDPQVLILDEPTSGLDPNQLIEIRKLIANIGKEKTVILSTHIMQEVEAMCDRIIIIDRGEIVADDRSENIVAMTSSADVVIVEFDHNVDKSQLKKIKGVTNVTKINEKKWKLHAGKNSDVRSDLFQFAVENNLKVLEMSKEEASLESVFQQLTKKK